MERAYNANGIVEGSLENLEDIDEQLANNLEIVAPEPVRVTFMEEETNEAGGVVLRPTTRVIRSYVPMLIFHQMLRSRQKIMKEIRRRKLEIWRSPENDGSQEVKEILAEEVKEVEQEIMYGWIVEQVLAVWKLTDKEMTFERLEGGLQHSQGEALFNRFFAGLIKSKRASERLKQANYERG